MMATVLVKASTSIAPTRTTRSTELTSWTRCTPDRLPDRGSTTTTARAALGAGGGQFLGEALALGDVESSRVDAAHRGIGLAGGRPEGVHHRLHGDAVIRRNDGQ